MKHPISQLGMDILKLLKQRGRPTPGVTTQEIRNWWELQALPLLKDQALSELRRTDQFIPKLIGLMNDGTMGIIDITKATGGEFGDLRSKEATARTHQIAACLPGVKASVFCVETWVLRSSEEDAVKNGIKAGISQHPDREEAMMFNMLHLDVPTNTMMQLTTMIMLDKVLGHNRSPSAWQDTKFREAVTTDPMEQVEGRPKMLGRFIFGDNGGTDDGA